MKRVFKKDNATAVVTTPYKNSFTVERDGEKDLTAFEDHDEAVAAHTQVIMGLTLIDEMSEIPPFRIMSKGDVFLRVRVPVVPEFYYEIESNGNTTVHRLEFPSISTALVACAELIHLKLAEGFLDVLPEWESLIDTPEAPYIDTETRDDSSKRRFFMNDDQVEQGPEFLYWDSGSLDAMFQIKSQLHGWQSRYVGTELLQLNPFLAQNLAGPVIVFADNDKQISVNWTYDQIIYRTIETKNGIVTEDSDPADGFSRNGIWTSVDDTYRIERKYVSGALESRTWFRLLSDNSDVKDERHVYNDDDTTVMEIYFDDGVSLAQKGLVGADGVRISWNTFPDPRLPEDEVVENSDGTITTTTYYINGKPNRVETRNADGERVGVSDLFHENGNPAGHAFHEAPASTDIVALSWDFTRLTKKREWASIPVPWPMDSEPIQQAEIDTFTEQIEEHLKEDWITLGSKRIFVLETKEERWIRPPVDGFLSWFEGEGYELELETHALAIKRFNRIVIGWRSNGWRDKPPSAPGEIPVPPYPYNRTIYVAPEVGPDQLIALTSWVLEPFTMNDLRFGPLHWKWENGTQQTAFFFHENEIGHRHEYRKEGDLLSSGTMIVSKKHGHQFCFEKDGGISSVQVFENDESISSFEVERSVLAPMTLPDQPLVERRNIEFSGSSYDDPWAFPKKPFEAGSNNKLKRGKIKAATAVIISNFDVDFDALKMFFETDAFGQVRSLSFKFLQIDAFEFACLLTEGYLDHIEHIKLQELEMRVLSDGVQEAVITNLFRLPCLKSIELNSLHFSDEAAIIGRHNMYAEQLANGISDVSESGVEVLTLSLLPKVGDASIIAACKLPNLKVLQLSHVSVGPEGLNAVLQSDIEQLRYWGSYCGDSMGLDIPFRYGDVRPLFDKLGEKLQTLEVSVDATSDLIEIGNVSDLVHSPPSMDVFRQILKSLQSLQSDSAVFEKELAVAKNALAVWPADIRNPQAYFVNDWIDGFYAFELISLAGSLRIADLCLETNHKPASHEVSENRLKTFATMIQNASGSVTHLDLTPRAWISAFEPNRTQLTDFVMPVTADFWKAISSAEIFSNLETLDISKPSFNYNPCSSDDYSDLHSFMDEYTNDLLLLETLENAVFRTTLKSLKLESLDPAYFGDAKISLPELQEIDLSARSRREALFFVSCIDAPKLGLIELRGDAMTAFALDTKFDGIDDESDLHGLQHDWGIYSQDDLDSELIDQKYLDKILEQAPTAVVVLAGEIEAKRVKKSKKLSEQRYSWPEAVVAW